MKHSTVAALLFALLACADGRSAPTGDPEPPPAPTATVTFHPLQGEVVVRVEVADEPAERQRGLMYRESLDDDAGMVFVFPTEQIQSFWMHNTYIPLDMIFVSADLKVVGVVANAEPMTDDPRTVHVPSQYVVEVNAGFAARRHIEAGVSMTMQGVPKQVER